MRHDTLLPRLARAAQPGRAVLRITLPPRLARFLIAAGAQAASNDSMTVHSSDVHARGVDGIEAEDTLTADLPSPQEADPLFPEEDVGAETAESAIISVDPFLRLAARHGQLPLTVVVSDLIVRLIELTDRLSAGSADARARADALFLDVARARALGRALARDLLRALGPDLAPALDPPSDLGPPIVQALVRALGPDLARAFILDFDRVRALISALDPPRDSTRARVLARDLARALGRDLDPDFGRRFFRLSQDPDPARARALHLDLARVLDLASDPDLARASGVARALEPAIALVSVLDDVHSRAVDLARARAIVFALAHDLDSIYVGAMSRSLGFDRLDGLATALLNGALDDFTQADLSNVDLADVDLTGVRWSMTTTQWPSNRYKDAVLQRSRQITPGSSIYVVISPLDPAPEDAYA